MTAGMLIDTSVVCASDGSPRPEIAAVLAGLRLRQAPFCLASSLPQGAQVALGLQDHELAGHVWSKPMGLLHTMQQLGFAAPETWLVTADSEQLRVAATAGVGAAVVVHGTPVPSPAPAIRIVVANDLADAPRVMVPVDGGCWHDHR
jgi:beta-phosphoglucomutase-like phosphatase (HAD superfamily)